jgi:hypothetical protein
MKKKPWLLATIITHGLTALHLFGTASGTPVPAKPEPVILEQALTPQKLQDFSFAYWRNGWRKHPDDRSPDILCFETGYYGLALDMADFNKTRFGLFEDGVGYTQALQAGTRRMDGLEQAPLIIEVETGGRTYRATTCRSGLDKGSKHLYSARMWESGRLVQHFDLLGLVFEDTDGQWLDCDGTLDIVAWPDTLALNLDIAPESSAWTNTQIRIRMNDREIRKEVSGPWLPDAMKRFTLRSRLSDEAPAADGVKVHLSTPQQDIPVQFDEAYSCYAARVKHLKRQKRSDDREGRVYDDFDMRIENSSETSTTVPFLLDLSNPVNITGLCPILCDENGAPTGIPVQLSKNWHHAKLGAYVRAYAMIPAPPGITNYKFRIVYGFYGTLPSASHAQLSLIGWGNDNSGNGNNGRWDQLAIGCWGETFCLDMDMSCTDLAITDVRMLMARNGRKGKMWNWTDAGWGGDWLNLQDNRGNKLYFNELKTAYLSHGPCLTEVRYDGFYGSERQVDLRATVRTLRTDDYARTFHTLDYTFKKPVSAADGWLFKMGRTGGYVTPKIAYGNGKGVLKERRVPDRLDRKKPFIEQESLTGPGPWWVAFPGAYHNNNRDWGTGSRALVIRSYRAVINGVEYTNPAVSFPVFQVHADGSPNLDMLLALPEDLEQFSPGDSVSMDLEWITLHRIADDYYGPNEAYRRYLSKNPRSWKTVHREAKGNDLGIQAAGGMVKHTYPLIILAERPEVQLKISGGVGAVPVRFDGLDSPACSLYQVEDNKRIKLDQSVHGNDFWQTDYDPVSGTYSLTFNLPLDGQRTSGWILRADHPAQ